MYQFMVATTRGGSSLIGGRTDTPSSRVIAGGEASTMSITSGTNKWASRFVVVLQLAAWSAVGIVLLEKGTASLQKIKLAKDEHKVPPARSEDVLSVIPLIPAAPSGVLNTEPERLRGVTAKDKSSVATDDYSATGATESANPSWSSGITEVVIGAVTDATTRRSGVSTGRTTTQRASIIQNSHEQRSGEIVPTGVQTNNVTRPQKNVQSSQTNELENRAGHSDNEETSKTNIRQTTLSDCEASRVNEETTSETSSKAANCTESPEDTAGRGSSSRKRLRFAQMNGGNGGVAAAVAMVVVGAVMLVLGPAVIMLRALDERRQERRFLKLSVEEDLPPTYEQATGSIEQAPTYSSLNLDTIDTTTEAASASGLLRSTH